MTSSASYSDLKSVLDNNALLSPALAQASLDYMRSSSPESGEPYSLGNIGNSFTKPVYPKASSNDSGASPLLSCPPSWFFQEAQGEDDNLPFEIPFSSSPPDIMSSSPKSVCSRKSEKGSSSATSASSAYLSKYVSPSQHNPSLVGFVPDPSTEGFGQQLHRLLLIAKREREIRSSPGNILVETSRSGSLVTRTPLGNGSTVNGRHSTTLSAGSSPVLISKWFFDQDLQINAGSKLSVVGGSSTPPSCGLLPLLTIHDIDEVSPIEFGSTHSLPQPRNPKEPVAYRLIKRAQSYIVPKNLDSCDEPHPKRQKTDKPSAAYAHNRTYARRTASLRRAESLTVVAEESQRISSPSACAPTVPATPVPIKGKTSSKILRCPVPIIAPPKDYVPRLPPSPETLSKTRLGRYLEREAEGRELDGLPIESLPPSTVSDVRYECEFNQILESKPYDAMSEWEAALGLGKKRRESVVNWLLDVLPPVTSDSRVTSPTPSAASSASLCSQESDTTSTTESSVFIPKRICNLLDQLQNSPETRFHAVWMFLRFFYRTLSPASKLSLAVKIADPVLSPNIRRVLAKDGLDLYLWDVAVSCLSLSVKFHRDFLSPLLPVYAQEYVAIAPHALGLDDLEDAHRDVLSTLQYRLGVTPQSMMDELWRALPSLRALLDFDCGWENAMKNAWLILFDALEEPDVLRFLISTLTVASLMDGIVESLVDRQCRREALKARSRSPDVEKRQNVQTLRKKFTKIAETEAEGVFCDFQALIGITDFQLGVMRDWLTSLY